MGKKLIGRLHASFRARQSCTSTVALWLAITVTATKLNAQSESLPFLHLADRIVEDSQLVGLEGAAWKFNSQSLAGAGALNSQQVVRWGSWRGVIDRPAVWLSDGSWLVGEVAWTGQEQLTVQNRWLQVPPISLRSIRGVVLSPAASMHDWIGLQQSLQASQGEDDVVWLSDRRKLTGVIDWSSLEGNTQIRLSTSGQEVTVPLGEVVALVSSPALFGDIPSTTFQIGLSDGSLLRATAINSSDVRTSISLPSVDQLDSLDRPGEFSKAITYVSYPKIDKVQQLDKLKPASYRHVPENQLEYSLGVGRDVNGNPLQCGQRRKSGLVDNGIAMHSSAQVAYWWDRSPGKFLAEVQLAQPTGKVGSVVCKVLLRRGGKLETATEFSLSVIDKITSHVVDVDLTAAELVVLIVEKADRSQFGDHVLWLDARFCAL